MPERRHRAVTRKMVLMSLVLGLVLAVVSVPVGAGLVDLHRSSAPTFGHVNPTFGLAEYFRTEDHIVLVLRRDFPTGTTWEAFSEPDGSPSILFQCAMIDSVQLVTLDSRPRIIRTALDGNARQASCIRAGWPFEAGYCLHHESWIVITTTSIGMWTPTAFGRDWSIPYLPLWPGLLANTLFYATPVFTALVGLRFWHTHRRRKRGRCVACGYEPGDGVDVCPECGLAAASGTAGGPARGAPDRS